MLFLDLDGFKLINDTCGHEVGDEVLMEVAHRLRVTVRPTDTVARLGGDEFVVLCTGVDADKLARRVSAALDEPILTAAGPVRVTASIGIADGQIPMDDPTELLHRADTAMYRAKRLGKDRLEVYDADLHRQSITRSRTETALRNALDDGRFTVHYQPIVELASGQIHRLRGARPAGGRGRRAGLARALHRGGRAERADRADGQLGAAPGLPHPGRAAPQPEPGAVHGGQRGGQSGRPAGSASAPSTPPWPMPGCREHALALELTESALLEADSRTLQQLNTLRAAGVQIALDDFGTGYSSLAYLRTFPVSHLKIDRSFVSGIADSSGDLAIVRAIAGHGQRPRAGLRGRRRGDRAATRPGGRLGRAVRSGLPVRPAGPQGRAVQPAPPGAPPGLTRPRVRHCAAGKGKVRRPELPFRAAQWPTVRSAQSATTI